MKRKMRNKKSELFASVKYFVCFALILSLTLILTACGGNVMLDDMTIDISDIISASASPKNGSSSSKSSGSSSNSGSSSSKSSGSSSNGGSSSSKSSGSSSNGGSSSSKSSGSSSRTSTPHTSICPHCDKGKRNCNTCGGKGTVTNRVTVPNYPGSTSPRTSSTETKPCPNALCHDGKVSCFFCGGDGQI